MVVGIIAHSFPLEKNSGQILRPALGLLLLVSQHSAELRQLAQPAPQASQTACYHEA